MEIGQQILSTTNWHSQSTYHWSQIIH